MPRLVLPNQSAFMKGRSIHDNFRAVHLAAKLLHARRQPCVLLKVDIAKAFHTVNWSFSARTAKAHGFHAAVDELDSPAALHSKHQNSSKQSAWSQDLPCAGSPTRGPMLKSTVGSFADQPSALLPMDHRLFSRSTVGDEHRR
jgi:hypothetical protein